MGSGGAHISFLNVNNSAELVSMATQSCCSSITKNCIKFIIAVISWFICPKNSTIFGVYNQQPNPKLLWGNQAAQSAVHPKHHRRLLGTDLLSRGCECATACLQHLQQQPLFWPRLWLGSRSEGLILAAEEQTLSKCGQMSGLRNHITIASGGCAKKQREQRITWCAAVKQAHWDWSLCQKYNIPVSHQTIPTENQWDRKAEKVAEMNKWKCGWGFF